MRALFAAAVLACACAYPTPRAYYPAYPYYNMDAVSMGGEGATVLSRYYQPYSYQQQPYWSGGGGGLAAFMYGGNSRANEFTPEPAAAQRYPLEQHERVPPRPAAAAPPELEEVTESTPRATALLFTETEDTEIATPRPAAPPARRLQGKKRAKKPTYDEVDDEETPYQPQPPAAYFPMFFGYGGGGRSGNGGGSGGGGATAIANAYSTGRGGVATSHATAYGSRPDSAYGSRPDTAYGSRPDAAYGSRPDAEYGRSRPVSHR